MTTSITFDYGDVTVTVPADQLLHVIARALKDRRVILWGPSTDISTDEGRTQAAVWLAGELIQLAHQAGIDALDDGTRGRRRTEHRASRQPARRPVRRPGARTTDARPA